MSNEQIQHAQVPAVLVVPLDILYHTGFRTRKAEISKPIFEFAAENGIPLVLPSLWRIGYLIKFGKNPLKVKVPLDILKHAGIHEVHEMIKSYTPKSKFCLNNISEVLGAVQNTKTPVLWLFSPDESYKELSYEIEIVTALKAKRLIRVGGQHEISRILGTCSDDKNPDYVKKTLRPLLLKTAKELKKSEAEFWITSEDPHVLSKLLGASKINKPVSCSDALLITPAFANIQSTVPTEIRVVNNWVGNFV